MRSSMMLSFWCSSKIYDSNIVQLEEYVVYRALQAHLIPITEKNVFPEETEVWNIWVSVQIGKNSYAHVAMLNLALIQWSGHTFTP